jgi:hypothetical protein
MQLLSTSQGTFTGATASGLAAAVLHPLCNHTLGTCPLHF